MRPEIRNTIAALVGAVLVVAFMSGLLLWADAADKKSENKQNRQQQFVGACSLLKGEVKDDACINNGTVVLTKKEFESK